MVVVECRQIKHAQLPYNLLSEPKGGHARQTTAVGSRRFAADEAAYPAYPLEML